MTAFRIWFSPANVFADSLPAESTGKYVFLNLISSGTEKKRVNLRSDKYVTSSIKSVTLLKFQVFREFFQKFDF